MSTTTKTYTIPLKCSICQGFKPKEFHKGLGSDTIIAPGPHDDSYEFVCSACGGTAGERFKHFPKTWQQSLSTTLYNLYRNSSLSAFDFWEDICPFIEKYWEVMCGPDKPKEGNWISSVRSKLSSSQAIFVAVGVQRPWKWGLRNYEHNTTPPEIVEERTTKYSRAAPVTAMQEKKRVGKPPKMADISHSDETETPSSPSPPSSPIGKRASSSLTNANNNNNNNNNGSNSNGKNLFKKVKIDAPARIHYQPLQKFPFPLAPICEVFIHFHKANKIIGTSTMTSPQTTLASFRSLLLKTQSNVSHLNEKNGSYQFVNGKIKGSTKIIENESECTVGDIAIDIGSPLLVLRIMETDEK